MARAATIFRRDVLEERLLGRLRRELLRPEVIDYAVAEFGRQLRTRLLSMSNDLAGLRRRKVQLEGEIQRFADAIARGGPLDALAQQIEPREKELKAITNRLLSVSPASIEGQLHELRQFVEKGIADLRTQLNRDTTLAKAELQKHLSEVRMTPAAGREEWHYVAEGNWDLLGTGPNAPVLGLARSDGCGGQI